MKTRRQAFTLIELLIVIVIIAVMASIVVPAYVRYLGHVKFRGTVREVQDLFAYAREQAIATDSTVTLQFDQQSDSFSVTLQPATSDTDQPTALSAPETTDNASAQVATQPRVVQLNSNQKVMQYTVTPATTTSGGAVTSSIAPATSGTGGQNDLHFQSDGTVEGMEMVLAQSDGVQAHLVLWPTTGRLSLDNDTQLP